MADAQGAVTGAASGATAGAAIGSAFPGPGTAIGAGVGAIAGGIAGALGGGGGSTQSGYTLPPEYELQYLQQFQQQMQQMQSSYQQIAMAYQAYDQKIGALNNIIEKGYSPEHFQAIQQSNFQLGQALGMDAQTMVKNGFITEKDQQDMDYMQGLIKGSGTGGTRNAALEDQIANQKRQLEQDLARSGVSPAQRAIALAQFEQSANQQRQQNSAQEVGQMSQLLAQRAGLRQQGYGQAIGTLGVGMQQGQQYMTGYQQLGQNYAGQQNAAQNSFQLQQGIRQEQNQAFQTMGQFKFSKETQGLLRSGVVGPGSMYDQTGVARNDAKNYGKYVSSMQSDQFRADNPGYEQWRQAQNSGWGFGDLVGGALNVASFGGYGLAKGAVGAAGQLYSGNIGGAFDRLGGGFRSGFNGLNQSANIISGGMTGQFARNFTRS